MDFLQFILTLDSTIRLSVVLLLACLAGLFSERSGIVDIGLEGKMLIAAFVAAAVAYETGNAWVGVLAGCAASVVFSMIHATACIIFRGDQIISGVALNFLASGLTVVIGHAIYQMGGQTPMLAGSARFTEITLPFADAVADVPVLGPIYSELISGHKPLVYLAFAIVPLVWWVLYRTRFGLRLRAVGENPASVDTAGISVVKMRFQALIITGILCGIAGAYLSTAQGAGFGKEMTAGRGYIALAALIFSNWRPIHAMGACLLFGLLEAVSNLYPNINVFDLFTIPVQFTQALPYILTVVILAGFIGKAIPPKSVGAPYVKES
ncbi:ABC transporter permease [Rhodobacteraceae bacterium R_SAG10]|jgi:simple sugar transport system permease protein|nr:ABC transporter permease [Rhodobacteraceae bacterium R_SAG10]